MLTFLFDQYKSTVLKQYRLRLYTIYLGLGSVLIIVGIALTIPTYVLLTSKFKAAELEKSVAEKTIDEDALKLDKDIQALRNKITLIETSDEELPIILVLEKLLSKRDNQIAVVSISLIRQNEIGKITLGGIASTREALVALEKSLKAEPMFSKVDLPVGSLAKNKDIPFSIAIDANI